MDPQQKKIALALLAVGIVAYSIGHSAGVKSMAVKLSSATSKELAVYLAAQDYFNSTN